MVRLQNVELEKLAQRYLEQAGKKLEDPETSLADIVTMYRELVTVFLMLHGQPLARKEVILKLMGAEGEEVSQEYLLVIEETLAKLIGSERLTKG